MSYMSLGTSFLTSKLHGIDPFDALEHAENLLEIR